MKEKIIVSLKEILKRYQESFHTKIYVEENNDIDILMSVFGLTPELKRENRQYWGRELGMCWQLLVAKIAEQQCSDYQPALKIEGDEPIDLFIGQDAIDTKYRIGSGDSGTLKKFKKYGLLMKEKGYNPTLLILREDNLPAAITACKAGGWTIYTGADSIKYIQEKTGFDILGFLSNLNSEFFVERVK